MSWENWSGRNKAPDARLVHARSEEDIAALLAGTDGPVRTAGSGHSHAPLVPTDGIILDLSGLSGIIRTDPEAQTATVWAGTPIYALGRTLHEHGLGLQNQGDIDRQTIAGAVATGTHGTGRTLQNFSAAVRGMTLITASGERLTLSSEQNQDLLQAARLHLGAFGVVTQIELACRPAYRLRQNGGQAPFPDITNEIEARMRAHRHYEFFWYPHRDTAIWKTTDETDDLAHYPLADEGARCAWSYEVLPNHRPHKHTEMEYSVPADKGLDCLHEIRDLLHTEFKDVQWPVEYRSLAADDVWLSTAYERETVTISVHQDINLDERSYYNACEAIFNRYDGRPHWGKVHYLRHDQLAERHPRWSEWWQARDSIDPNRRFADTLGTSRDQN